MSELRFDDRVAIVTGAGGGLGREYALLLASRGAKVLVNDYGGNVEGEGGSLGPANKVVSEIGKFGGVAVANSDSVATVGGGASIVKQAFDAWGRVDIVINNAGITLGGPFEEMTAEGIENMHAVHLHGAFNVLRPAWKIMLKQGYGRILNTASNSVFGSESVTPYATPKAGLVGLTKALAAEGEQRNIKVNALMPAAFTRMTEQIEHEEFRLWLKRNFPPALVAPLAIFLVHEDVPCTGEIISSGGGRSARVFFAEVPGFQAKDHTMEEIQEHFGDIMNSEKHTIINNLMEDIALFIESIGWDSGEEGPSLFDKKE
jgi:NAD(P)-dependent dehydrogenase (short-subunit alcohol dehydrogenase family)